MLRHPATTTSLVQALRLGCIDTQSPAGRRLGCIDAQPPQPPEYYNMYSACTSSDRSINLLTTHSYLHHDSGSGYHCTNDLADQGGHQPIQDWLVGLDWTLLTIQSSVHKLVSNPIHWPWIGWMDWQDCQDNIGSGIHRYKRNWICIWSLFLPKP
jgi:hypothetical protein